MHADTKGVAPAGLDIGEVRALEAEADPVRRRALALRLIRALTPSDRELLAGELTKPEVLLVVERAQNLSWSDLIGAHHAGHEHVEDHGCDGNRGVSLEHELDCYSITSVGEDMDWDGGDAYGFCECVHCGEHLRR